MDILPFDPTTPSIALVVFAFVAAGLCKGILGIGIPLLAVPLLTGVMGFNMIRRAVMKTSGALSEDRRRPP